MSHEILSTNAGNVLNAFGELSIPEQQAFFAACSKSLDLPTVVRDVAKEAAEELAAYMSFHNVPLMAA